MALTMFDKIWMSHLILERPGGDALLHIDRNFVHEGSFHAFGALAKDGRKVRKPRQTFAVADHYVPTVGRERGVEAAEDEDARNMIRLLEENCRVNDVAHFGIDDERQGIVHVIGPELGLTQPGLTITCGDSHTSTHGALGAFAFGTGASQLKQILATQCLWQKKTENAAHHSQWRAASGRNRQGRGAGDHRQNRHCRSHWPCHRIRRLGDSRPHRRRPAHRVQHGHRSRWPRRHDRAGRQGL